MLENEKLDNLTNLLLNAPLDYLVEPRVSFAVGNLAVAFDLGGVGFVAREIKYLSERKSLSIEAVDSSGRVSADLDITINSVGSIMDQLNTLSSNVAPNPIFFRMRSYGEGPFLFNLEKGKSLGKCYINNSGMYFAKQYYSFFYRKNINNISYTKSLKIGEMNIDTYLSEISPEIHVDCYGYIFFGKKFNSAGITTKSCDLLISQNHEERSLQYGLYDFFIGSKLYPGLEIFLNNKFITNGSWNIKLSKAVPQLRKAILEFIKINDQNENILF